MALDDKGWSRWFPMASSNPKRVRWQQNNKRLTIGVNPLGTAEIVFHQGRRYRYFRVRFRQFVALRNMARPGKFFMRRWAFGFIYQEV